MASFTAEELLPHLQRRIETAQHILDTFEADFKKDPVRALVWSQDTFVAAARLQVNSEVLKHLAEGCSLENLRKTVTQYALAGAKFPKFSTSPCTNLMEAYRTAAYAEITEDLGC